MKKISIKSSIDIPQNIYGELPSFDWIDEAHNLIRQLSNTMFGYSSKEVKDNFLDANSDLLLQWNPIKYLGRGVFGDAWLLDNETVLKIFVSGNNDYQKYQDILQLQYDGKAPTSYPKIYDLGQFRHPEGFILSRELYYVVLEKVETVKELIDKNEKHRGDIEPDIDEEEKQKLKEQARTDENYLSSFIQYMFVDIVDELRNSAKDSGVQTFYFDKSPENINNVVKDMVDSLSRSAYFPKHHIEYLENILGLKANWKEKLARSIVDNIINDRQDTHSENFGFRNEQPVFFDAADDFSIKANRKLFLKKLAISQGVMPNFDWLKQGINFMNQTEGSEANLDDFLDLNSDVLASWHPVKYLGSGASADAWLLDDGRVLKIFENLYSKDYQKLSNLKNEQDLGMTNKETARIYEIGLFQQPSFCISPEGWRRAELGYAVIEKVKSFNEITTDYQQNALESLPTEYHGPFLGSREPKEVIKTFLRRYFSSVIFAMGQVIHIQAAPYTMDKKLLHDEILSKYSKYIPGYFNKDSLKKMEEMLGMPQDWESKLAIAVINFTLKGREDLHSGNIGFRNETPVFFDF